MNPPANAVGPREPFIDALRGFAALLVLYHHLLGRRWGVEPPPLLKPISEVFELGFLGVPLFFVISGYCVGRTWLTSGHPGEFLRRRFWRLFPAYWASLALAVVVIAGTRLLTGVNDIRALPSTPPGIIATVTLFTWPASPVATIVPVYWSLTFEVAFYLLLGALLLLPPRHRVPAAVALTALFLALEAGGWARDGTPGFVASLWPLFALGLAQACTEKFPGAARLITLIALGHLALRAFSPASPAALIDRPFWLTSVAGVVSALLVAIRSRVTPNRVVTVLASVGVFSYSLYLTHFPLGFDFALRRLPLPEGTGVAYLLRALLISAVCIGAAWVFWRCFELPFQRKRKAPGRMSLSRSQPAPAAETDTA